MFMTLTLRDWWLMQWSTWCLRNSIAKRHQNNGTATNGKFRDCTFVKIKNLHRCVGWFDVQLRIQSPIQAADCAGAILSLIFSTGVQAVTVFYNLFGLVLNVFTEAGAKPVEQFNSFVVSFGPRSKLKPLVSHSFFSSFRFFLFISSQVLPLARLKAHEPKIHLPQLRAASAQSLVVPHLSACPHELAAIQQ